MAQFRASLPMNRRARGLRHTGTKRRLSRSVASRVKFNILRRSRADC